MSVVKTSIQLMDTVLRSSALSWEHPRCFADNLLINKSTINMICHKMALYSTFLILRIFSQIIFRGKPQWFTRLHLPIPTLKGVGHRDALLTSRKVPAGFVTYWVPLFIYLFIFAQLPSVHCVWSYWWWVRGRSDCINWPIFMQKTK